MGRAMGLEGPAMAFEATVRQLEPSEKNGHGSLRLTAVLRLRAMVDVWIVDG